MANSSEKFLYFLIGGFVGASVALLFAPKSGEETRRLLETKYREGTGEIGRKVKAGREFVGTTRQEISEKVHGTMEKGKETVARQKEQLTSALDAGRKAYQDEKAKLETEGEGEAGS
jgi:gas vesicle protein